MISGRDGYGSCAWCGRRCPHDDSGLCAGCGSLQEKGHTYGEIAAKVDRLMAQAEDAAKDEEE